jgi:flagellar motor switch/type III secretory pathway protein FliN
MMNALASTHPFPWKSLETTRGLDVAALRAVRGWVAQRVRLDALGVALTGLVGDDVRLLVGRATGAGAPTIRAGELEGSTAPLERDGGRGLDEGVGVVLTRADDDPTATALLDVESALAAAVVSRVVRRPPPVVTSLAAPPSAALAGAFAAVVVAAARRAHTTASPLRVVAAGMTSDLETEFGRGDQGVLAVSFTVLVGDEAYAARLVLRRETVSVPSSPAWTAGALASLGALPLSIPIVACATRAQVADVAALRVGDAWLPGAWPLELAKGSTASASLHGPVLLAAPGATSGVRARLAPGGRLVLSGEADGVCAAEADMTESDGERALLEAVGDVPVVVRVEIGEARMAARDWASLGRGDVITLGRRVGELVLLRVGGVAIARGELVNVDGEIGVRIAERLAGDTTSA